MEKELRKRMLAKTERNRIRRKVWRKFLQCNPNWEESTKHSKQVAELRRQVSETCFQGIFQKKIGIFKALVIKVKALFARMRLIDLTWA